MKKFSPVTIQKMSHITCDVCGREHCAITDDSNFEDVMESQEFTSISFTGGYGSIFGDQNRIELDICQHCLKQHLGAHLRITDPYDGVDED